MTVSNTPKVPRSSLAEALALAGTMGFTIAVPLVLFVLGGRYLDRQLGTSPWLLLTGLGLAVTASTILLVRKFSQLLQKQ